MIAVIAAIASHCRPIAAIAAHCRPLSSAAIGGNGWQWTAMTSKGDQKKTKKVSIKWHLNQGYPLQPPHQQAPPAA